MKLYTLEYVLGYHNNESNTDSFITYRVHGIVEVKINIQLNVIAVFYDSTSPLSSQKFDLNGELISLSLKREQ